MPTNCKDFQFSSLSFKKSIHQIIFFVGNQIKLFIPAASAQEKENGKFLCLYFPSWEIKRIIHGNPCGK